MKGLTLYFDLDDTLIKTRVLRRHCIRLAVLYGVPRTRAVYVYTHARHNGTFSPHYFANKLFPGKNNVADNFVKEFVGCIDSSLVYPGVRSMLIRLQKRYTLAILTWGDSNFQKLKLHVTGLTQFFKTIIITSDQTKQDKLRQLAILVRPVLVIDNDNRVCRNARSLSVPAMWITGNNKQTLYFKQLYSRIIRKAASLQQ